MALDTRNKRAAAAWPLLPFRMALPLPDGTIDQADRQAISFVYAGILAAEAVITSSDGFCLIFTFATPVNAAFTSAIPINITFTDDC